MKKLLLNFCILAGMAVFVLSSCQSPVTLTSWKNPNDNSQISKVVIMTTFGKLEYSKPFEQSMAAYFNSQGLKAIESISFLNPTVKYADADIQRKIDSIGADAVLIFNYKGTDKSASYIPPTYYGGWGGFYGGFGGYYGGGVATGGYWTTTSVVNLTAYLYNIKKSDGAIWTADISVTDPNYVDQSANTIAQNIYADWQKNNLLKFAAVTK